MWTGLDSRNLDKIHTVRLNQQISGITSAGIFSVVRENLVQVSDGYLSPSFALRGDPARASLPISGTPAGPFCSADSCDLRTL